MAGTYVQNLSDWLSSITALSSLQRDCSSIAATSLPIDIELLEGMNRQHYHHQQPRDDAVPLFEALLEYYNGLPPITRVWLTFSLLATGLNTLEVFPSDKLIFLWHRVQSPNYELWRILTSFSWAGPGTLTDFHVLILMYSMAVTVPSYEKDPHDTTLVQVTRQDDNRWVRRRPRHRQSDCIFAFLSCSMLILISYLVVTETSILFFLMNNGIIDIPNPVLLPVFTRTLLYAIITLHSLKHPDQQHNINFFPVPGRYVPLFHIGFGILMGYRINETAHGVVIGMIYAFLVRENEWFASLAGRKRIISSPLWLIQFVGEDEGVIQENESFNRYPDIRLEPGANSLHHAAAIGDTVYIQYKIDEVESRLTRSNVTSGDIASITALFRQKDRNGWQPIHEAARSGKIDVMRLLLEVDHISDQSNESRAWRRRAGKLKVDVNARTNGDRGVTPLRLVEENHGADCDCAELLHEIGAVSLGFGDEMNE